MHEYLIFRTVDHKKHYIFLDFDQLYHLTTDRDEADKFSLDAAIEVKNTLNLNFLDKSPDRFTAERA